MITGGGLFGLERAGAASAPPFEAIHLVNARSALALIVKGLGVERAWIPSYVCAAVPEALLQSEIVQAHGGTLFLNEIGELPAALQARLLHVLEKREMRLIAASRSSLEEKTRRGEFREDLFYRLQGLVLALPRLDERTDKRALIRHVFAQETADTPSVSLGEDLTDLFNALTGFSRQRLYRKLLVAPANMRFRFVEMIERETANAREGKPARIIVKMNALVDAETIEALYWPDAKAVA